MKTKQANTYEILGTGHYVVASNIKEAKQKAVEMRKERKLNTAYIIVKRCYNGGVRG